MRLRKPCEHDRYEPHTEPIDWCPYADSESGNHCDVAHSVSCPGGEFLPEDALVIEKVEGEWPWSVLEAVWTLSGGSAEGLLRGFDALAASRVGEPGT